MTITHESVVSMLDETLKAVDGAGSDLVTGWRNGEWLDVQGNLDLHHLASDIMLLADQAKAEALREAADAADDPSPDEMDFYQIDQAQAGNWLRARADQLEGKTR